jgi:streptomycin 6-kinase
MNPEEKQKYEVILMNIYKFSTNEQATIVKKFGGEFFDKMQKTLESCVKKWCLSVDNLIPYFSVNCIFICRSELYGETILKIGRKYNEAATEAGMLTEYNGHRFCRLYAADVKNGALLLEKLSPGKNLFYETDADQRIIAFAGLYNKLHLPPRGTANYPTYQEWIERFIKLADDRDDIREHGSKAMYLYDEIVQTYSKTMLLHGDLHHENILSDGVGYRIIDPKGVIGDPVFDCSRFIMDEFDDNLMLCKHAEIKSFTEKLGKAIDIPAEVLLKCLYIETVISMGEDLFYFNWLDDDMIDNALQAETLMKFT